MDIVKYNKDLQNPPECSRLTSDVYFLIQRFLSNGLLKRTLQTLNEELQEHQILPRRIDWEGGEHERSVDDMVQQYPYIHHDFLYYLCNQASAYLNPNSAQLSSYLSFRPKAKNKNGVYHNCKQYYNYVTRLHGAPIQELKTQFNIVNSIRGREMAGPFSRHRAITPRLYTAMQNQRITLGHLSAVYCLLFDHSGRYVITGADDLLIKLWSTYTGRLIAAFRGASSEITDIAIDPENSLLAAGSIDRILRVWSLQTGAPIAVLTGHTGMITSVNFCPTPCWGLKYLISTSTDGSIAFWTYQPVGVDKVEFRNNPILYQEKIRPGQAQMICSSFSPGGTFLATGSADHHVRVYYMKGDEGPQRILETEAHTDRVDSMQWAHSGLRFLSGSKDGTANIWWFERQQWKSIHLDMATKLPSDKPNSDFDGKKIRVTMVAWDRSDSLVVTAVSDHTLKVWTASTGQLVKVLSGHTDEVYVLEPHPHDDDVILSAGHDGQLLVWDINKGEIVAKYLNTIEGQGYGAIFDVKWSPDGCVIAASDSHGNILTFGFGNGSVSYQQLPKELFFHTDYRPLVRDQNYWVLDEQTQVPPHLMPPPFLVDIDGNPYPPMLQRSVPGRESCNVEQLVPNIVIGNEGTQEVIQDIPRRLLEDSEDEDVRGNAGGSHRSQRIRQSTGDWQTDHTIEWKKNVLVKPLSPSILKRANEIRKSTEDAEMKEYQKQLRQRPHMISTAGPSNVKNKDKKKRGNNQARKPRKQTSALTPITEDLMERYDVVPVSPWLTDDSGESSFSDWAEEVSQSRKTRPKRRKNNYVHESSSDNDDDDTDDSDDSDRSDDNSDEVSDREKVERKPRSSRENNRLSKEKSRKASPKASTSRQNNTPRASAPKSAQVSKKEQVPKVAQTPKQAAAMPSTSGTANMTKGPKIKVSEQYKLSEWLAETRPRKSPYYPQIGDEIVYFVQGHQLYVAAVKLKNVYEPNVGELPWTGMELQDHEYCKVIGIQYEIKPPRLCCLKLALQNEAGQLTGNVLTIKYHDMPDVLDFFVLKQCYQTALTRDWQPGDRFRCMIDDNWWIGEIENKSPASDLYPNSVFMCYYIRWTNGEQERMSPWDMEPIDEQRLPEDEKAAIPVLAHELRSVLYKPTPEDWPNCERDTACKAIARGFTQVMELAIAEPFLVPVDINVYPTYALIVEYPIDLSTMKARFENNFYRRMTSAQFDIGYLATNAEKFNKKHSVIVKHARILTELCLRIVRSGNNAIDIASLYHQLVDGYDSPNTEEEADVDVSQPSTSRTLRCLPVRSWKSPDDWKVEARGLLELMWQTEDSVAFREPVSKHKYPTYHQVIKIPMDLGTVKEKLDKNKYQVPQEFCIDMRLIFQNSRTFNTNKRSKIYVMTVRLSAMFEEHIKRILYNWRISKKRQRHLGSAAEDSDVSISSSRSSNRGSKLATDHPANIASQMEDFDSDSDNTPLGVLKAMSRSNTATESENTLDKLPSYFVLDASRGRKNNSAQFVPEPSTSSQSLLDDFDHNYTNKRLMPEEHNPLSNGKKKSDDSDAEKPSTSSSTSKHLSADGVGSSDSNGTSFPKNKKVDKEYKPPSYVKILKSGSSSDEDDDDDSSRPTGSQRKKEDAEYKPPVQQRRKVQSSSESEDVDGSRARGSKTQKRDTEYKRPAQQRRKVQSSSESEDDDHSRPTGSKTKEEDTEYKPPVPQRRKAQSSFESDSEGSDNVDVRLRVKGKKLDVSARRRKRQPSGDEDFFPNETSSSSRSKKTYPPSRRRRKNSSELDEDFKMNGARSQAKRKPASRKRKTSFVVGEDEEASSEESSSNSDSSGDMPRKVGLRRRPKKNKMYMSSESDSESNSKPRGKRRKVLISETVDSDVDSREERNGRGYFASVSSRGRVRKITERAAAFLKKDKKGG